MKRNVLKTALAVFTALMLATALSACGGGGSSSTPTSGLTNPTTPVTTSSASLSGSAQ